MTKWDKVLIGCIIIFSLAGLYWIQEISGNSENLYLVVEVDGHPYKKISLDSGLPKQTIDIKTEQGYNKIEVDGLKARIEDADCRDQLCVKAGWLQRANQISVCLPNKVAIKLVANRQDIDIISY